MAFLELQALTKSFGATTTLHGIDLAIAEGEFIVFVGPSGCGKSTLLRLIAGLESSSSGAIRLAGSDVTAAPASQRQVAMVFQSYALYPHMTVAENLSFGMRMRGVPKAEIQAKTSKAVEILQLQPYLDRKPGQLSGGQAQRVAIGRALVQEPALFLFDEPLSNLDAELRLRMRVEIAALHKQLGRTMIYVTHDQTEAMTLADRIVVLRAGRIEQVGAPMDLYADPINDFAAGFIGAPAMNFLKAQVVEVQGDAVSARLAGHEAIWRFEAAKPVSVGQSIRLGLRPEHALVVPAGEGVPATVKLLERLGASSFAHVATDGETLALAVPAHSRLDAGQTLHFAPQAGWVYAFDADGRSLSRAKTLQ